MSIFDTVECGALGCHAGATRRGFCRTHYDRARAGTSLRLKDGVAPLVFARADCRVPGCTQRSVGKSLCQYHRNLLRRVGELRDPSGAVVAAIDRAECSVDGCGEKVNHKGLCLNHYRHLRLYGDPLAGARRDGRSKVWHKNHHGYVVKYCVGDPHALKNGIVAQHRQVMGEHIGRPLYPTENVHHKNGDRADNRIENLELWSKSQPAGQRVKDKVAWAREILAEYGDLDV